ncbi:MAG: hypothetical protein AAGE43_19790, partial [Pseudomonadota bacterium]
MTLTRFVHALRSAELPVSPAETMDAFEVVQKVGIDDRELLRNALSLALAKSAEEKLHFSQCFSRFFDQLAFKEPAKQSVLRRVAPEELLREIEAAGDERLTEVARAVVDSELDKPAWRVQEAAERVQLGTMQTLRDKSRFTAAIANTLGMQTLERLITQPETVSDLNRPALRYLRQYIQ